MENIIEIKNLYKSFKDIKAVENLSFNVREGELFAFLGVNGAGKSTTISIICGQLNKDSGIVKVCGKSIDGNAEIKRELGVVFQNSLLDKYLSVYDNLRSRAALYGISGAEFKTRLDEITELLDMKELLKRPVGKLSGGQRRRADIARAIIHNPSILILDEPTTGLDPQTRKLLWYVVERLRTEQKMTVLLTTHYMEEANDADYVVIIEKGKIAAEGTPYRLKNDYTGDFITIYGVEEDKVAELGYPYAALNDGYRIEVPNIAEATKIIVSHSELFTDYEVYKGKMDDVFIAVTGKKAEEAIL